MRQKTLRADVQATGIGLHSGRRVRIHLKPAPVNTGIVFRRIDCQPVVDIPVSPFAVGDTRLASTLEKGDAKVSTVEHLMSALYGLGIDNLFVELDALEVPIMDGSAAAYIFLLQQVGVVDQPAFKQFIRVKKPVEIREGQGQQLKFASLTPHHGFKLSFEIDFQHPAIDKTGQRLDIDFANCSYVQDVARARTFGFTHDVEALRNIGLARGGNLDNAIVMDEYRILNPGGLRYDDEFVKHKILDAIGDLYLAGKPLLAAYSAFRSGHALNNRLLRELFNQPDAYEIVHFENSDQAPAIFQQDWV